MQKQPGQTSFEAYNTAGANPGKTYDDKPIPAWENLSDDVRTKWAAAERAAVSDHYRLFSEELGRRAVVVD